MYCKNCGKRLPDNARFCDRCNRSVRKKDDKMNLIEGLKEERIARKKAKAVQERLKSMKKIRHRRVRIAFGIVIALILAGVISGVVTNIIMSKESGINTTADELLNMTEEPTAAPTGEAVVIGGEKTAPNSEGYIIYKTGSISFAYPATFSENETHTAALLELTDSRGDARITFNRSASVSETPADAMKGYIEANSITSPKASASDTGYSVTGESGEDIYHRCSRIGGGSEIYYELIYPADSAHKSEYEEYAAYMDNYIKGE